MQWFLLQALGVKWCKNWCQWWHMAKKVILHIDLNVLTKKCSGAMAMLFTSHDANTNTNSSTWQKSHAVLHLSCFGLTDAMVPLMTLLANRPAKQAIHKWPWIWKNKCGCQMENIFVTLNFIGIVTNMCVKQWKVIIDVKEQISFNIHRDQWRCLGTVAGV